MNEKDGASTVPAGSGRSLRYAIDNDSLLPFVPTNVPQRSESKDKEWQVCCSKTSKNCIMFTTQVVTAFSVLLVALYHVSAKSEGRDVWVSLLASSMGFLMPNPKLL